MLYRICGNHVCDFQNFTATATQGMDFFKEDIARKQSDNRERRPAPKA